LNKTGKGLTNKLWTKQAVEVATRTLAHYSLVWITVTIVM